MLRTMERAWAAGTAGTAGVSSVATLGLRSATDAALGWGVGRGVARGVGLGVGRGLGGCGGRARRRCGIRSRRRAGPGRRAGRGRWVRGRRRRRAGRRRRVGRARIAIVIAVSVARRCSWSALPGREHRTRGGSGPRSPAGAWRPRRPRRAPRQTPGPTRCRNGGYAAAGSCQATRSVGVQIRARQTSMPGSGGSSAVRMPCTNARTSSSSSCVPTLSSRRRRASSTDTPLR